MQAGPDILLVVPDMDRGGTQRVVSILANTWAGQGLNITLLAMQGNIPDAYRLDSRVRRIRLGLDTPVWPAVLVSTRLNKPLALVLNLYKIVRLRKLFRQLNPVRIVSFITTVNIFCIIACAGLKHKLVICERNDPGLQSHGFFWDLLRRRIYHYAHTVTANSSGALQSMRSYVPEGKLYYVPNPISPDMQGMVATGDESAILAAGRLVPQKGFDVLIEAFAIVAERMPNWRVRIVGDGPEKNGLERLAKTLGIDDRVEFTGSTDNMLELYQLSSLFVLSSRYEGMPNVLLEAMQTGLAVVVTDASPGPLEVVQNGRTGLVVAAEDRNAMAEAILYLATNPAIRQQLGVHARNAMRNFHPDRVISVWNKLLAIEESTPKRVYQST